MFERFTDRARRVVVLAQEEARLLNHNYIGTEHLLLGLVHEGEGVAAKALERLGVSLDAIRARVQEIIGQGGSLPVGHIPFTPRAKKVLELSLREALQLGHNYIGTEHILLGLVREGEGVAANVLAQLGVDLTHVRQEVIQLLSGYTQREAAAAAIPSPDTPAAIRTVEVARRLAGDDPVGTDHYLQAILRDPESVGAKALAALGVTADVLDVELARLERAGTTDELPEEAGARNVTVELVEDRIAVFLADESLRRRLDAALAGQPKVVRSDDPTALTFPGLWQDLTRHLNDLTVRLERAAKARWRPPEWASPWDVAAYAVVHDRGGMQDHLEVAEGVDRRQVRGRMAEWLAENQLSRTESAGYLSVLVSTTEGGEWQFELSFGDRPDGPTTSAQYLIAHAILVLKTDSRKR